MHLLKQSLTPRQSRWIRVWISARCPGPESGNAPLHPKLPYSRRIFHGHRLAHIDPPTRRSLRLSRRGCSERDHLEKIHHVRRLLLGNLGKLPLRRCSAWRTSLVVRRQVLHRHWRRSLQRCRSTLQRRVVRTPHERSPRLFLPARNDPGNHAVLLGRLRQQLHRRHRRRPVTPRVATPLHHPRHPRRLPRFRNLVHAFLAEMAGESRT